MSDLRVILSDVTLFLLDNLWKTEYNKIEKQLNEDFCKIRHWSVDNKLST